jgi:hypothetical protein
VTDQPTSIRPARNALSDLRQYVRGILYDDTVAAISYLLPVADPVPPYDDRDVYDSRLSGADLREVRAAEKERPVEEYEPPKYLGKRGPINPETGELMPSLFYGYSDRDTTSAAASSAPGNAWILARQAPERHYERVIPREIVRGVAQRLCPDDQQALRGMARLGKPDPKRAKPGSPPPPPVTVKHLAREAGVRRETIQRRHHDAAKALLAGLYDWHASNPDRRVA